MSFFKKAQQQVAHTSKVPVLGNQDLRSLQDLISTEKFFIQSSTKAASDFKKNADALKAWCTDEGEDLYDVLGKLSVLFDHYSNAQNRLNSHLSTERLHFKSIRTREESLADLKSRKRSLGSNIEKVERKLAKMGPENKELMKVTTQLKEMRNEMESLRIELMQEEAAIGDFKRRTAKEALGLKCAGLLELAEKLTIVAQVGKLMLEEIPLHTTTPGMPRAEYLGFAKTELLLQDATRAIADVTFAPSGPSGGVPQFGSPSRHATPALGDDSQAGYYNSSAAGHADDGYDGHRAHDDTNDSGFMMQSSSGGAGPLAHEDLSSTPIYATHASTARQAHHQHDAQGSTFNSEGLQDTAANEWGQIESNQAHETTAAHIPDPPSAQAEYGPNVNVYDDHNDMYVSNSAQGSAAVPAPAATGDTSDPNGFHPRTSADQHASAYGGYLADQKAPSSYGHSAADAYGEPSGHAAPTLGAPMLPPLRTSTPLPPGGFEASSSSGVPAPAPVPIGAAPGDDASYFQSIGATRAHQDAVRRPTSPPLSPGAGAGGVRMSSYGAPSVTPEGKKVTAAAFRKGFNRVPSSQAVLPAEDGGDLSGSGAADASSTQPLHIQKRNSSGAARYSVENINGTDNPAPPYGA